MNTDGTDKTTEKESQNSWKNQEQLFHLLIEDSIDMIALLDKDGRYVYISPSHERILGYTSDDLLGKKIRLLIHPDDLPRLLKDAYKAEQGKLAKNAEFRIKHKDGHWVTVEGSAQALLDEKGKPIISVARARDVTERKQFENNLAFLSEVGNILSSSLDYNLTLQRVAKLAAGQIAEWSIVDLLTEDGTINMVTLWHEDPVMREAGIRFRTRFPRNVDAPVGVGKAIRTGTPQIMIYQQVRGTIERYAGNKEYIEMLDQMHITTQLSVPLKVHDHVIGAITLASSQKNREFSIEDIIFAEEVAHRAALAIDNAQHYQEAQQVIASKNDFIAMVSHELKTPVTSLKIHTQILEKKLATSDMKLRDQFVKMGDQIDQLTSLIDELLDFSRMQRKKLIYHKEVFAIDDLIREITTTMGQATETHTITLKGHTKKEVRADKNRIGQVLTNLISNAMKYSRNAKDIYVTIHEEDGVVVVSVQDFGIGISKEHQRKIFEQFYQVTDSVGKTFAGLGIGLYLSAEIIKEHHGQIWVESTPDKGSTFSFRLPTVSHHS